MQNLCQFSVAVQVDCLHYLMRIGGNVHYKGQSGGPSVRASVRSDSHTGMTPLHAAAEKGNEAAVSSSLMTLFAECLIGKGSPGERL